MIIQTKQYSGIGWKGRALIGLLSTILSMLPLAAAVAESGVSVHVRIFTAEYSSVLEQLRAADYDVVREDEAAGFVDLVVDEDVLKDLYPFGSVTVIERSRPFREIQLERGAAGMEDAPDVRYKTFAEVLGVLNQVQAAHPDIAQVVDLTAMLGTPPTWENRHLYAMKISDNVAQDEDEPVILFDSLHHARELNTIEASLGLINQLTAEYSTNPDIKALVDKLEIWVVPVVNPDGLEFVWSNNNLWRKNRRNNGNNFGVDLNRNYPFKWGECGSTSANSGSDTYRGPAAASEPESQTLMALGRKVRPVIYNSYHSSGRIVLWDYRCGTTADAAVIRSIRNSYRNSMSYGIGTPSASGESFEWFYNQISSVAFLTEMDANGWQPAFPVTESEVERLKPGWNYLLGLLAEGRHALVQGHVTNVTSGAPVEAEISSSLVNFVEGERRASEPLAGRYGWFLEQNKQHALTFSADGYEPASELVVPTLGVTELEVSLVPLGGGNRPPVADAGVDQTVDEETPAVLDGNGSRDPDGTITGYQWGQVSGPSVVLTGADSASSSFTAPSVTGETVLSFELVVTDDQGETGRDTVNITVRDTDVVSGVDLVVDALNTTQATVQPGDVLTFTMRTTNQGAQPSGATFTRLVLSSDAVIDATDLKLRGVSVPILAGGASSEKTLDVVIPVDVAPGPYFLGAIADNPLRVTETDESNNTFTGPQIDLQTATPDGPDLIVSALSTTQATVQPGGRLKSTVRTTNQGTAASARFTYVRLMLSADAVIDDTDRQLKRIRVPKLAAGAFSERTRTIRIPANVVPGSYFIGAIVDRNDRVVETDEGNNTRLGSPLAVQ